MWKFSYNTKNVTKMLSLQNNWKDLATKPTTSKDDKHSEQNKALTEITDSLHDNRTERTVKKTITTRKSAQDNEISFSTYLTIIY